MTTVNIQLQDDKARRIQLIADRLGISIEEFVQKSIDEVMTRKDTVQMAFSYVLEKNAELYRRLAK